MDQFNKHLRLINESNDDAVGIICQACLLDSRESEMKWPLIWAHWQLNEIRMLWYWGSKA